MRGIIYQYELGNKLYIGKTYTEERKRKSKHKSEAFALKKETPFARAIRKYGWEEALKGYSVIEEFYEEDKQKLNIILCEREIYWIKKKNTMVPNGYNCNLGGQLSIPHTYNKEEIYKRISKSLKGKYMNPEATSKKVYCIEQKKWYPSIREAERQNGIARGSIGKVLYKKAITAGGYRWSFTEEPIQRENLLNLKRKPIICIETNEIYNSIHEAARLFLPDENWEKTKPKIQFSLKYGWAVSGYHFKYLSK